MTLSFVGAERQKTLWGDSPATWCKVLRIGRECGTGESRSKTEIRKEAQNPSRSLGEERSSASGEETHSRCAGEEAWEECDCGQRDALEKGEGEQRGDRVEARFIHACTLLSSHPITLLILLLR